MPSKDSYEITPWRWHFLDYFSAAVCSPDHNGVIILLGQIGKIILFLVQNVKQKNKFGLYINMWAFCKCGTQCIWCDWEIISLRQNIYIKFSIFYLTLITRHFEVPNIFIYNYLPNIKHFSVDPYWTKSIISGLIRYVFFFVFLMKLYISCFFNLVHCQKVSFSKSFCCIVVHNSREIPWSAIKDKFLRFDIFSFISPT